MDAQQFKALTGFEPSEWSGEAPVWAKEMGFAEPFRAGAGLSLQDYLQDRALLTFEHRVLPDGFPGGMALGRALLEARSEFLKTPFAGPPFRDGENVSVLVALTSVGENGQTNRPCRPVSPDAFLWLCQNLQFLGDPEASVTIEGEGGAGLDGTVLREYHCLLDIETDEERQEVNSLFTPLESKPPRTDPGFVPLGLHVVNTATRGIGLFSPGDPYWQFLHDPAIDTLATVTANDLGLPDYPILADFGGTPSRFAWLPFTEQTPRLRVRLEVVQPGHPRHRAQALAAIPRADQAGLPDAIVVVVLEYLSPLHQRCRGFDGPAIHGTSVFMQYGKSEREEIAAMCNSELHRHRYLNRNTMDSLEAARRGKLL